MAQRPNPFQAVMSSLKRLVTTPLDLHPTLTIKTGDEVTSVAIGQWDGQDIIMTGFDHTVQVWDKTGNIVGLPIPDQPGYELYDVALGHLDNQDLIMSAGETGLQLWNPAGDPVGPPMADADLPAVTGRFDGQEAIIAFSLAEDCDIAMWDAGGGFVRPLLSEPAVITALAIGRLGDQDVIVFGGLDGNIQMADTSGRRIGRPLTDHTDTISSLVITQLAGQDVIISGGHDDKVRIWDADGKPIHELTAECGLVLAIAVGTLNGRQIIAAGGYDGVLIWDADGELLGTLTTAESRAIAIGRFAGRDVIVTGHETEVRIWTADPPAA